MKSKNDAITAFLILVGIALLFVIASKFNPRQDAIASRVVARAVATPTIADCLYQDMPVGEMMPIVPECNYRKVTVQWNAYVRIFPTRFENGTPIGLRWRNVPTLYTPSEDEPRGQAQGTAFTFCLEPANYNFQCSNVPMYFEEVIYREPIPELGWLDKGYWGRINKWGWYPFCVTLPGKQEVCYTDWTPTPNIVSFVNGWKISR